MAAGFKKILLSGDSTGTMIGNATTNITVDTTANTITLTVNGEVQQKWA